MAERNDSGLRLVTDQIGGPENFGPFTGGLQLAILYPTIAQRIMDAVHYQAVGEGYSEQWDGLPEKMEQLNKILTELMDLGEEVEKRKITPVQTPGKN